MIPQEPDASMNLARFCERCKRLTIDGNLWCQDRDCPAEQGYPVFAYGDNLGDLKITKLITVWRTAALYESSAASNRLAQSRTLRPGE